MWETLFDEALITRSFLPGMIAAPPTQDQPQAIVPKIAAFDMDATLIKVKSGKDFPIDEKDWEWLFPSVPTKLQQLYKDGFEIVIFTNQNGIDIGKKRDHKLAKQLQMKIDALMDQSHVPITTYISCDKDRFRKPSRGMFDFMLDGIYTTMLKMGFTEAQLKDMPELICKSSFYCGDACARGGLTAGDIKKGKIGPQKDHSGADYGFAVNCFGYVQPTDRQEQLKPGQKFYAPEELFEGRLSHQAFAPTKGSTTPYDFMVSGDSNIDSIAASDLGKYLAKTKADSQLVLLVGLPASGKTTYAENLMAYLTQIKSAPTTWVNRDVLKTPPKCLAAAQTGLASKTIVIVDNTNVDVASRKEYINLANKHGVAFHCVYFEPNVTISKHLNLVRTNYFLGERERLPGVAINMANSKFAPPTPTEAKFQTFVTVKHTGPTAKFTAQNPRPSPPAGLSPQTTEAAIQRGPSEETLSGVGPVTGSRRLDDCYYQIYDH